MEGSCSVSLWFKECEGKMVFHVVFIDIFNIVTAQYSFSNAQVIMEELAPRQYGIGIDTHLTYKLLKTICENPEIDQITLQVYVLTKQVVLIYGDTREDITSVEEPSLEYTELFNRDITGMQRVGLSSGMFSNIITVMCIGGIQTNIILANDTLTIHSGPGPCQLSFSRPYTVPPEKESRLVLYTRYLKYLTHLLAQCQHVDMYFDKMEPLWVTGMIHNCVHVTTAVALGVKL
jgi:hypothetical protein